MHLLFLIMSLALSEWQQHLQTQAEILLSHNANFDVCSTRIKRVVYFKMNPHCIVGIKITMESQWGLNFKVNYSFKVYSAICLTV